MRERVETHGNLVIVAPSGGPARFVRRMLEPYDEDMALRTDHVGGDPIEIDRPGDADVFVGDLRAGGYEGIVTVGVLTTVAVQHRETVVE